MDFNNLRREAERHLGKDFFDRAEDTLRKHAERKKDEPDSIVAVKDVQFDSDVNELVREAKSRLQGRTGPEGSNHSLPERSEAPSQAQLVSSPAPTIAGPPTQTSPVVPVVEPTVQPTVKHSHSAELLKIAVQQEYLYSRWGLLLGFSCILAGVVLGLNGVAGSTSWTAKVLGLESQINDAAPGVVVFIVGVFFVFITRPKVKLEKLSG